MSEMGLRIRMSVEIATVSDGACRGFDSDGNQISDVALNFGFAEGQEIVGGGQESDFDGLQKIVVDGPVFGYAEGQEIAIACQDFDCDDALEIDGGQIFEFGLGFDDVPGSEAETRGAAVSIVAN